MEKEFIIDKSITNNGCVSAQKMTKREYFAAMAMQGLLANTNIGTNYLPIEQAIDSVKLADALIKALNEPQP